MWNAPGVDLRSRLVSRSLTGTLTWFVIIVTAENPCLYLELPQSKKAINLMVGVAGVPSTNAK